MAPTYYLRKTNRVTGACWTDATPIGSLEEARQKAQGELSSGEFDEVEILDANFKLVETVRRP